jgi:FkbM family methyltransferase
MGLLGRAIKFGFRSAGFELQRVDTALVEDIVLKEFIGRIAPDLVIDVGASAGQYGALLRRVGYTGVIVSIEPLPEAHAKLLQAALGDGGWKIAPRVALARVPGHAKFFVASNSASSSLKEMLPRHERAAPHSRMIGSIEVNVTTLDSLLDSMGVEGARPLLKIDTQGGEADVLGGAQRLLPKLVGAQIEMSLEPLYKGQPRISEIVSELATHQIELTGFIPGFRDPTTRRLLQIDGLFSSHPRELPC